MSSYNGDIFVDIIDIISKKIAKGIKDLKNIKKEIFKNSFISQFLSKLQ